MSSSGESAPRSANCPSQGMFNGDDVIGLGRIAQRQFRPVVEFGQRRRSKLLIRPMSLRKSDHMLRIDVEIIVVVQQEPDIAQRRRADVRALQRGDDVRREIGPAEIVLVGLGAGTKAEGLRQMRLYLRGVVDEGGDQIRTGGEQGRLVARTARNANDLSVVDHPGDQAISGAVARLRELDERRRIEGQLLKMAIDQFEDDVPVWIGPRTGYAGVERQSDLAQEVDDPRQFMIGQRPWRWGHLSFPSVRRLPRCEAPAVDHSGQSDARQALQVRAVTEGANPRRPRTTIHPEWMKMV